MGNMKRDIRQRIDETIIETLRNVEPTVYRPKKPAKSKLKTYTKNKQKNNPSSFQDLVKAQDFTKALDILKATQLIVKQDPHNLGSYYRISAPKGLDLHNLGSYAPISAYYHGLMSQEEKSSEPDILIHAVTNKTGINRRDQSVAEK